MAARVSNPQRFLPLILLSLPQLPPQTTSPCASPTNDMAPSRILAAALCLISSAAAATAPCSYVFSVCSGGGGAHGVDFRSHFSVYGAQHGIGGWVRNACDDCVYGEFAGVRRMRRKTPCVCGCVCIPRPCVVAIRVLCGDPAPISPQHTHASHTCVHRLCC